ncbi:MAG TPA: hypothetical protein VMA86_05690 [Acetobacteraceae bacterium]|nr:hypothetical protein [Acetobacteraceae bacterium]
MRQRAAGRRQAAAGTAPELAEEASEEGPEPRRQINGAPAAARARDAPDPEKPTAASFVAPRNEAKGRRCGKRRAGLGLDRATELRMEEEFLAGKRAPDLTIDDVVRFLRQQGDVVVSEAGGYRVNYGDRISADQLVERANDKRRRRGQQAFVFARNGADHSSVELPAHASG